MPLFGKKKPNVSNTELIRIAEDTNGLLRDTFRVYVEMSSLTTKSGEKVISSKDLPSISSDFKGTLTGIAENYPILLQNETYRNILLKSPYSVGEVNQQYWWTAINNALKP